MKINAKVSKTGWIDCNENCPFSRSCANHTTAGDYRTEGGFTPEVALIDGDIYCATHDQPISEDSVYQVLPENHEELSQGAAMYNFEREKIEPYDPFGSDWELEDG